MNEDGLRLPDLEVIVNAGSYSVAIIAFYRKDDLHQGFEVVAGVNSSDELKAVREILQHSISALSGNDWVDVDVLRAWADEDTDAPPF